MSKTEGPKVTIFPILLPRHPTLYMVFKCVNNLAAIYLCNKLSKRSEIHKYSTRHCGDLNLGLCRTEAAKQSFFYRAVKHFNDLTSDTRSVNSVSIFKSLARRELLGK